MSEAEIVPVEETKPIKTRKKANGSAAIVPVSGNVTPMALIQLAMNQNADISKLEKLMELQLRWEANEAKKSYVAAMNRFKSDLPEILKNKHVQFGNTQYDHATLDHVCDQVAPALSKYGISHRWKVEQIEGMIKVTCILTHEAGHSEETALQGSADNSGSKNSIQAIGSAITYLERYSLLAATGLAAKGQDTDAMPPMAGLEQALDAIAQAPDLSGLEYVFKGAYKDAMAQKNAKAMLALIQAKDARKKKFMEDEPA